MEMQLSPSSMVWVVWIAVFSHLHLQNCYGQPQNDTGIGLDWGKDGDCNAQFPPRDYIDSVTADSITTHTGEQRIFPGLRFTCDGSFLKWVARTTEIGNGAGYPWLQVWRRNLSADTYILVAETPLLKPAPRSSIGEEFVLIEPFPFRSGDILGIFQPSISRTTLAVEYTTRAEVLSYFNTYTNSIATPPSNQFVIDESSTQSDDYLLPLLTVENVTNLEPAAPSPFTSSPATTGLDSSSEVSPLLTVSSTQDNPTVSSHEMTTTSASVIRIHSSASSLSKVNPTVSLTEGTVSFTSLSSATNTHSSASLSSQVNPTASLFTSLRLLSSSSHRNVIPTSSPLVLGPPAPPDIEDEQRSSSSTPLGLYIGSAIGVVVSMVLIVGIVILMILVLRKRQGKDSLIPATSVTVNEAYGINRTRPHGGNKRQSNITQRSILTDDSMMDNPQYLTSHHPCIVSHGYKDVDNSQNNSSCDLMPAPATIEIARGRDMDDPDGLDFRRGFCVPTLEQRAPFMGGNIESPYSMIYSVLMERHFEVGKAPSFFEERKKYWVPASTTEQLYRQFSKFRYREIPRPLIRIKEEIGSGHFGTVSRGVWHFEEGSKEVAVKMLKSGASEDDRVMFLQEAAIVGQFHHPNVVTLYGVVTLGDPVMIVVELVQNGDLKDYLGKLDKSKCRTPSFPKLCVEFCKQIAVGMEYLASKSFVHRDLAARNVLLTKDNICKITDFGMSRNLEDDDCYHSQGGIVPVKWTAPEAINFKRYSTASDVWSFGAVMYEIWSIGQKPFEQYPNMQVVEMVSVGYRLPPPPGCPRNVYKLMINCWHPEAGSRPSFSDLLQSLSRPETELLSWTEEDTKTHPQAAVLGGPLDAGKDLYPDLQNQHISE